MLLEVGGLAAHLRCHDLSHHCEFHCFDLCRNVLLLLALQGLYSYLLLFSFYYFIEFLIALQAALGATRQAGQKLF